MSRADEYYIKDTLMLSKGTSKFMKLIEIFHFEYKRKGKKEKEFLMREKY